MDIDFSSSLPASYCTKKASKNIYPPASIYTQFAGVLYRKLPALFTDNKDINLLKHHYAKMRAYNKINNRGW